MLHHRSAPPTTHLRWITTIAVVAVLLAGFVLGRPTTSEAAVAKNVDIVVLGGTSAVSSAVETQLRSCTEGTVSRISGRDRFQTAAATSASGFSSAAGAFVATGYDFPDALAGGAAAGYKGQPVLLVGDTIPGGTSSELQRLGVSKITVLGGSASVSQGVMSGLGKYAKTIRISGPDRYATAAATAQATFGSADVVYIATGTNFPDALAGVPAAIKDDAPILLVTRTSIPAPTAVQLSRLKPSKIKILGGTAVVSAGVAADLAKYAPQVIRLAGANRYSTATAISRSAFGSGTSTIYIATGDNYPDALAAGPVAGLQNAPILLTQRDTLANPTRSEIERLTGKLCGPPPPPPGNDQPVAPIRAAFMYPWFPKAWDQGGYMPFTWYTPSLGLYDSANAGLIDKQVSLATGAGLDAFIASWWGPGHETDSATQAFLNRIPSSPNPDFRLAIYYEEEGQSNPSATRIKNDLTYLQKLFDSPSYLRVDGKPVVFVWSRGDSGADLAKRWADAKKLFGGNVYVVLKVFSGFRDDPNQPDSWHQYGPASAFEEHLPYSSVVSPGFWLRSQTSPRLSRDVTRFRADAEKVASSGAFWQLVTTWNEWGEGTSVEPAKEYGNAYLDILADAFGANEKPPPPPPPSGAVTFTAAGDLGAKRASTATLNLIAKLAPDAHYVVGDLSYNDVTPESAWCAYVKNIVGATLPFELLSGNHEDDNGPDGFIRNFTACMPDRLGAVGDYGVQYYTDLGNTVRVINIAAALQVDGVRYRYTPGSPERKWLESAVAGARAQGRWVVIMHHKVCISAGDKDCSIGEELADWEAANADVVVMGHAHMYQRSHQLSCVDPDKVTQACIVDKDGDHQQGKGAVFVVNGLGGMNRPVDRGDNEAGYFAALLGTGDPKEGHGVVQFSATPTTLTATFRGSDTTYTDTFTIRR